MKKIIFVLIYLLFSGSAFASFAASGGTEYQYGDTWFSTRGAACTAAIPPTNDYYRYALNGASSESDCIMNEIFLGNGTVNRYFYITFMTRSGGCPANSTGSTTCTCNAGFVESGNTCVPHVNTCNAKVGQISFVNRTFMYTRSSSPNDLAAIGPVTPAASGQTFCNGGCVSTIGAFDSTTLGVKLWISQVPTAQGLFRQSIDVPVTVTGAECTASTGNSDAPNNPSSTPPPCPGYVGEVNGVKGCYGTADKPVISTQASAPGAAVSTGNPAAGTRPSSGEGSGSDGAGRTPSAGSGGPDGGPSSAVSPSNGGSNPSGTISKPSDTTREQQNCGAPGQAKCTIDESGTPDGKGAFDSAGSGLDNARATQKTGIDGAANISAPSWSFGFTLPSGCQPFPVFRGVVLNMCAYQPVIHDLMSLVWAAATVFCIIGMVGRTIREA